MSRQLLIMRHAKSDWSFGATSDFERPLNRRGLEAAPKMGKWLNQQNLIPDYIVSSPAKRAKQTIKRVCRELGIDRAAIHWDKRIYEAGITELCQVLADCPANVRRVLLVGHNPGLQDLILFLCGAVPSKQEYKPLPTATIAHLDMPADWQNLTAGGARLLSLTRPRDLADDGS